MNLVEAIKTFLSDVRLFSLLVVQRPLRAYQLAPAKAIIESVIHRRGLTFAVVMSRQAGKNELSAQVEAYLMNLHHHVRGASIIKASPTCQPQAMYSKARLMDCLDNPWNRDAVHSPERYCVRLGRCRAFFFSAQPSANVVGATASLLLECDEAQDVDEHKWSKDFAPMAASTNATTVFYGTVWTSRTLLARVVRRLRQQERSDGIRRVFMVPWQEVAQQLPAYGQYVRQEMARLGADHPIIKTQYKLEEIDEAGRLFTAERVARMKGAHRRQREPRPGEHYVITVDVAGEDEQLEGEELREANPRKDSTVATVFRVDLSTVEDPLIGFPRYEVMDRHWRTGVKHSELYATLLDLVRQWQAHYLVVYATGVGAGLASFLGKRLGIAASSQQQLAGSKKQAAGGGIMVPFEFSLSKKSDLGWNFIGVIESGRYKDYANDGQPDTAQFWREVGQCEFEVLPGPGKVMRWGVPEAGVHDDMLISAALVAVLDGQEWRTEVPGEVIAGRDHLRKVDRGRF